MAIQINGSTGISGVNGTGTNPVYSGGDSDTGIFFPALGQVAITTNGVQRLLITETGDIQSASVLSFPGGSASAPSIAFTGDTDTGLYSPSANSVAISTAGSGRLFVDASGRVGIGASGPGFPLEVRAASSTGQVQILGSDNTNATWRLATPSSSVVAFGGALTHAVAFGGFDNTTQAFSERLRITSAGLVGVGTNSPAPGGQGIHIHNSSAANSSLRVTNSATGATDGDGFAVQVGSDGTAQLRQFENLALTFETNATERLRITGAGLVGVGTSSPSTLLHIQSTDPAFRFKRSDAGTDAYGELTADTSGLVTMKCDPANAAAGSGFRITVDNSEALRVDSSRRVGIGTSSPASLLSVVREAEGTSLEALRLVNESPNQRSTSSVYIGMYGSNEAYERARILCGNPTDFDGNNGFLSFWTRGSNTLSERARIDSSGRLLVGTSSARSNFFNTSSIAPSFQIEGTTYSTSSISLIANGNTATVNPYPVVILGRTRGTSVGSTTVVSSGDVLGGISYQGSDGAEFVEAGSILCEVDSTPGTNDMPGRLVFSTTADGASSSTERMRITSAGLVGIGTSSPTENLTIYGNSSRFSITGLTGSSAILLGNQNSSGANNPSVIEAANGALYFGGGNSWSGGGTFDYTMTLTNDNKVGIGTTNPSTALSIGAFASSSFNGGVCLNRGPSVYNFYEASDGTNTVIFGLDNTLAVAKIGSVNSYPIGFFTGNAERLRITSAGFVGVGTSSPLTKLDVRSGVITAGSGSSTSGTEILRGYYSETDGALAVIGTEQSSGGIVIGYAVKPSTSSTGAFLSSTTINIARGAYTIAGNTHKWYIGAVQTVAENSSVSTSEVMRIDSSGRVGIGTTSPVATLHSRADNAGSGSTPLLIQNRSVSANTAVGISFAPNTSDTADRSAIIYGVNSSGGSGNATDLTFHTNANGGSPSEKARIDSSGRLLVGTSSASVFTYGGITPRLQVEGTDGNTGALSIARNSNDANAPGLIISKSRGTTAGSNTIVQNNDTVGDLRFEAADGTQKAIAASIACIVDGTPGANDMPGRIVLSTTADGAASPTERMRIGQNGYIQCSETGTYSPDGGSVWHKFYQSVNERCLQTYNTAGTFTNYALTQYIAAGGGTGSGFASGFSDSGSIQRYIIFSNGNIQNTNNSYGAISDLKLKENIVDASEQWNDIKNLRVRKYNLKQGGAHTQIGVIAQEIELVSPGLVYETTDRDTDGNDLGTVTKSVNYSVLYMKAVKALQEAMERIENLEAENAHQKTALTDILFRISALEGA